MTQCEALVFIDVCPVLIVSKNRKILPQKWEKVRVYFYFTETIGKRE